MNDDLVEYLDLLRQLKKKMKELEIVNEPLRVGVADELLRLEFLNEVGLPQFGDEVTIFDEYGDSRAVRVCRVWENGLIETIDSLGVIKRVWWWSK